MDLETENRIAALLMKEAAELRRQAEKEGVHVYLQKPNVRGRPNARFLTATVLGVQQANRSAEVNEMWRVRQKELELDDRLKGKPRDRKNSDGRDTPSSGTSTRSRHLSESCHSKEEEGLRDEELEEFLHSRVKRGRGAVGSRMDETGPYLPPREGSDVALQTSCDVTKSCVVYGPEKPSFLGSDESSEEEADMDGGRKKKAKRDGTSKRHSSKEKSKKRKRDGKRRKHHK